ncbi:MAG TPA: hypothetical protein DCM38_13675, partial [Gammaproteobacteria bacterium]|nr:hypothetical protein [Gammaproteobacteria bacterium]
MMNTQQLRELMLKELPGMMLNDSAFRETILSIGHAQFADKAETESYLGDLMARFERTLKEEHKTQAKLVSAIDKL